MNDDDQTQTQAQTTGMEKLSPQALQALAVSLDRVLNGEKVISDTLSVKRINGFVLIAFPFGDKDGKCHYVSNGAGRDDIIKLMTEQLKQLTAERDREKKNSILLPGLGGPQ
jgi:hypothetical protein